MTDVIISSKDVIVEVQQPIIPPAAPPPRIGLVEINQVVQRGSAWMTGHGPPTNAGGQFGDMYLDMDTGDVYLWDGVEWDYQGTFAPSTLTPEEILAALKTVDGDGSDLDADLLDGQHGAYYARQADMTANNSHDAIQDDLIQTNANNITGNTNSITELKTQVETEGTPAAILAKIKTVDGHGSGLDADTLDGRDSLYFATDADMTAAETRLTAVEAKNVAQDTAIGLRLTDAPNDANTYGRKGAAWVDTTEEAPNDGLGYMRKNGAWVPSSGGATTDDAPPAGPLQDGQLWWKSSTGVLYLWYVEPGDAVAAGQWVQCSASPQIVDQNYARKTAEVRNRVTNPAAQISQEHGTTAVVTAGYPADQWQLASTGIVSVGQKVPVLNNSPDGALPIVQIYATTAKPTLGASDYLALQLPIEGVDVADLGWGTAFAKPIVLRFDIGAATAGRYGVTVCNSDGTRSWCGFVDITSTQTRTFYFAIPGDTAGTWKTDNGIGLSIRFSHACGANYVGVAGWQDGNKLAPAGCINAAATINKALYATAVGLYADPEKTGLPPPFAVEDDATVLAKCLRYWEATGSYDSMFSGNVVSGGTYYGLLRWMVIKRTVPTVTGVHGNNINFPATLGLVVANDIRCGYESRVANATGAGMFRSNFFANARM